MTNTNSLDITTPAEVIKVAALLSAIELLVAPEFGNDWIVEMLDNLGFDREPTEDDITAVVESLMVTNFALAAPLIKQLPDALRAPYLRMKGLESHLTEL